VENEETHKMQNITDDTGHPIKEKRMPGKQTTHSRISRREAFRLAGAAGAVALAGRQLIGAPAAAQSTTTATWTPGGVQLADRKTAALREIEGYDKQARFHNGAIREMGRLLPGAKANVEAIVKCAYLAAKFGYHTLPLIQIAQLAAQCDHECPHLLPIAELAVLNLSGTSDVIRLAHAAVEAQTKEEKSQVQQTIEQLRAAAGCANIEEALDRQSRLFPSLPR
jgi:hypothetical protein